MSTNQQVADRFMDKRPLGTSRSNNLYSEDGMVLYSYRQPIAEWTDSGDLLLNGDRFTITTAQHQGIVRGVAQRVLGERSTKYGILPFSSFDFHRFNLRMAQLSVVERVGDRYTYSWTCGASTESDYGSSEFQSKHGESTCGGTVTTRHYLGGGLFACNARHFLASWDSIDRGNFFITEIVAGRPHSVTDAYEALKPEAVLQAENAGIQVLRQGDVFFILT